MRGVGRGQAKIGDFRATVGSQKDVVRFNIAMNDAEFMADRKALQNISRDLHREYRRNDLVRHDRGERWTVDELHVDGEVQVDCFETVDSDDVWMQDLSDNTRFLLESVYEDGVGSKRGVEDFYGHLPRQRSVFRKVYHSHTAATEFALNGVLPESCPRIKRCKRKHVPARFCVKEEDRAGEAREQFAGYYLSPGPLSKGYDTRANAGWQCRYCEKTEC